MDRLVELGRLFDFYGDLLTEKQNRAMAQYVVKDYSLSEIAEQNGVTRQAVRDTLEHAEEAMQGLESHLGLMSKTAAMEKRRAELAAYLKEVFLPEEVTKELITRLDALCAVWEDDHGV